MGLYKEGIIVAMGISATGLQRVQPGLYFGAKKQLTTEAGGEKAPVITPKGFEIALSPDTAKKTGVVVTADQVAFSRPLSPRYSDWLPKPGEADGQLTPMWTMEYVGNDQNFYDTGYRWGVPLQDLVITKPNGKKGINLPDGRYMIAITKDKSGGEHVTIGIQERGIDLTVLGDFARGIKPQQKEILQVSNHTMLVTRGKPVDWSDPDSVITVFAGEVGIRNQKIDFVNDQSGQFFGPKGLTRPKKPEDTAGDDSKLMKNTDYDHIKSVALSHARQMLEDLTGQDGIRMVKVLFEDQNPPEEVLRTPHTLSLKNRRADRLSAYLQEPEIQGLFDRLDNDPASQDRLLSTLSKNGGQRYAVLAITAKLEAQALLKPEQSSKLAVELLETPQALGLFVPESPLYVSALSDNTKRKVVTAYNALGIKEDFSSFVQELRQYPTLVAFLTGRRVAGGFMKLALSDLQGVSEAITLANDLTRSLNAPLTMPQNTPGRPTLNVLFQVYHAKRLLNDIERRVKKHGPGHEPVLLYNNPFDLPVLSPQKQLPENIRRLRELSKKGLPVYRLEGTAPDSLMEDLAALYTMAGEPRNAHDAVLQQQLKALLKSYGIKPGALLDYTQGRFESRWSNDQILVSLAAFGENHKPFQNLLSDLIWFYNLPPKSHADLPS